MIFDYSIRDRKARIFHTCSFCKKKIHIGEYYTIITIFIMGKGYRTRKSCLYHSFKELKLKWGKLWIK